MIIIEKRVHYHESKLELFALLKPKPWVLNLKSLLSILQFQFLYTSFRLKIFVTRPQLAVYEIFKYIRPHSGSGFPYKGNSINI